MANAGQIAAAALAARAGSATAAQQQILSALSSAERAQVTRAAMNVAATVRSRLSGRS